DPLREHRARGPERARERGADRHLDVLRRRVEGEHALDAHEKAREDGVRVDLPYERDELRRREPLLYLLDARANLPGPLTEVHERHVGLGADGVEVLDPVPLFEEEAPE